MKLFLLLLAITITQGKNLYQSCHTDRVQFCELETPPPFTRESLAKNPCMIQAAIDGKLSKSCMEDLYRTGIPLSDNNNDDRSGKEGTPVNIFTACHQDRLSFCESETVPPFSVESLQSNPCMQKASEDGKLSDVCNNLLFPPGVLTPHDPVVGIYSACHQDRVSFCESETVPPFSVESLHDNLCMQQAAVQGKLSEVCANLLFPEGISSDKPDAPVKVNLYTACHEDRLAFCESKTHSPFTVKSLHDNPCMQEAADHGKLSKVCNNLLFPEGTPTKKPQTPVTVNLFTACHEDRVSFCDHETHAPYSIKSLQRNPCMQEAADEGKLSDVCYQLLFPQGVPTDQGWTEDDSDTSFDIFEVLSNPAYVIAIIFWGIFALMIVVFFSCCVCCCCTRQKRRKKKPLPLQSYVPAVVLTKKQKPYSSVMEQAYQPLSVV